VDSILGCKRGRIGGQKRRKRSASLAGKVRKGLSSGEVRALEKVAMLIPKLQNERKKGSYNRIRTDKMGVGRSSEGQRGNTSIEQTGKIRARRVDWESGKVKDRRTTGHLRGRHGYLLFRHSEHC